MNKATQDKKVLDIGANLFVGNLSPEVDEKMLYDTFCAFGGIVATPKIMRDPETNVSKGYGFVQYESFEAADYAIDSMNGQFYCGKQIVVQFAFKKDSGERHGSAAERFRAQNANKLKPNTMFGGSTPPAVLPGQIQSNSNILPTSIPPPPPPPMGMMLQNGGFPPPPPPVNGMMMMPPPMGMSGMMMPPPPPGMMMQPPPGMMMQPGMMPPTGMMMQPPPGMIMPGMFPPPPPPSSQ